MLFPCTVFYHFVTIATVNSYFLYTVINTFCVNLLLMLHLNFPSAEQLKAVSILFYSYIFPGNLRIVHNIQINFQLTGLINYQETQVMTKKKTDRFSSSCRTTSASL